MECVQVGIPADAALDVLPAIASADIVVAKARAALEAMSCARAVYVFDAFGGDGWVTADNYAALEADGFAGLATRGPRRPGELAGDLAEYASDMGWVNNELVRTHHSARSHIAQLLEVLRGQHAKNGRTIGWPQEVSRLARLFMHAEGRAMSLWRDLAARELDFRGELDDWRARTERAEARADQSAARVLELEEDLSRARTLLATRRARAGIAMGRVIDRLRRRDET